MAAAQNEQAGPSAGSDGLNTSSPLMPFSPTTSFADAVTATSSSRGTPGAAVERAALESASRAPENTLSKLGTVRMYIRDGNNGGAASPAGKLRATPTGALQVHVLYTCILVLSTKAGG